MTDCLCPKCFHSMEIRDDSILNCDGCHGTWVPHWILGETFEKVGGSHTLAALEAAEATPTGMVCPDCSSSYLEVAVTRGVEVDFCRSCRGFFLDRGEIQKLWRSRAAKGGSESLKALSKEILGDWGDVLAPLTLWFLDTS